MIASKALVSLAEVKAFLPIRNGNFQFDDRLRSLIRTATSQIEHALGRRRLTRQRHTQYFRTIDNRSSRLTLVGGDDSGIAVSARNLRYVLAGFPVVIDAENPFNVFYFDEQLPASSYSVNTDEGTLRVQAACGDTVNGLRVEYTAGFPIVTRGADNEQFLDLSGWDDIKQACVTQVLAMYKRHSADNAGMDSEQSKGSSPGGQFTGNGGLVPEASGLLRPYKVQLLGLS